MQTVKAQISKESTGGFLAIPRAFVRTFWHLLRLKEIAFLVALVDLADGRWAMPLALAQIAQIARLSSGAAREVVAHLERAGLVRREPLPHASGVYRWSLAHESEALAVAQKLAHRPRLKVKARAAQLDLPIAAALEGSPPEPTPAPPRARPRLALVLPPDQVEAPRQEVTGCQAVAAGNSPATTVPPLPALPALPALPRLATILPPPLELEPPPSLPAPPEPLKTQPCGPPDFDDFPAPAPAPPLDLVAPVFGGLSLQQIASWAGQSTPDEAEGARLEPPAPLQTSLPLPPQIGAPRPPQIGALPAPNQGAEAAPNRGAPRPKSGRPLLIGSKHDLQTEIPTPPAGAGERTSERTSAQEAGGSGRIDLHFLGELAALLCPGLPAETARGRIADLPGITTASGAAFLREQIPAARARGARFPFGAALACWPAWQAAQRAKEALRPALVGPAPATTPRRPGEARPVAARVAPDFLDRVRSARQALQRGAPAPAATTGGQLGDKAHE